jgi:hypothetical protein
MKRPIYKKKTYGKKGIVLLGNLRAASYLAISSILGSACDVAVPRN